MAQWASTHLPPSPSRAESPHRPSSPQSRFSGSSWAEQLFDRVSPPPVMQMHQTIVNLAKQMSDPNTATLSIFKGPQGYGLSFSSSESEIEPTTNHFVTVVKPGSPAATAGVVSGDRIIAVNGVPVINLTHQATSDLMFAVGNKNGLLSLKVVPRHFEERSANMGGIPTSSPTPSKPLPENWVESTVGHLGKYYVNTITGQCSWTHPSFDELDGITEDDWNNTTIGLNAHDVQPAFKITVTVEETNTPPFDIEAGSCDFGGTIPLNGLDFYFGHDSENPKALFPMRQIELNTGILIERGQLAIEQKVLAAQRAGAAIFILINNRAEEGIFNVGSLSEEKGSSVTIPVTNISKLLGYEIIDLLAEGNRVRGRIVPMHPSNQVPVYDRMRMPTSVILRNLYHAMGMKLVKKNDQYYIRAIPTSGGSAAELVRLHAKVLKVKGKNIDTLSERKVAKLFSKLPVEMTVDNHTLLPDDKDLHEERNAYVSDGITGEEYQNEEVPTVPMADIDTFLVSDIGKQCQVGRYGEGVIKFVGFHHIDNKPRIGVELNSAIGRNNGTLKGAKYFDCNPMFGVLVPPKYVRLLDVGVPTTQLKAPTPILLEGGEERRRSKVSLGGDVESTTLHLYPDAEKMIIAKFSHEGPVGLIFRETKVGLVVSEIAENSQASKDTDIEIGMILAEVNSIDALSMKPVEVSELIEEALASHMANVRLEHGLIQMDLSLGLEIGLKIGGHLGAVHVEDVVPNGLADISATAGQIDPIGKRIESVNCLPITSKRQFLHAITSAGSTNTLNMAFLKFSGKIDIDEDDFESSESQEAQETVDNSSEGESDSDDVIVEDDDEIILNFNIDDRSTWLHMSSNLSLDASFELLAVNHTYPEGLFIIEAKGANDSKFVLLVNSEGRTSRHLIEFTTGQSMVINRKQYNGIYSIEEALRVLTSENLPDGWHVRLTQTIPPSMHISSDKSNFDIGDRMTWLHPETQGKEKALQRLIVNNENPNGLFMIERTEDSHSYIINVNYKGRGTRHLVQFPLPGTEGRVLVNEKSFGDYSSMEELLAKLSSESLPKGWPARLVYTVPVVQNTAVGVQEVDENDDDNDNVLLNFVIEDRSTWLHPESQGKEAAYKKMDIEGEYPNGYFMIEKSPSDPLAFILNVNYKGKPTRHLVEFPTHESDAPVLINRKPYGVYDTMEELLTSMTSKNLPRSWPVQLTRTVEVEAAKEVDFDYDLKLDLKKQMGKIFGVSVLAIPDQGLYINELEDEGLAQEHGEFKVGQRILAVDAHQVNSAKAVMSAMMMSQGESVRFYLQHPNDEVMAELRKQAEEQHQGNLKLDNATVDSDVDPEDFDSAMGIVQLALERREGEPFGITFKKRPGDGVLIISGLDKNGQAYATGIAEVGMVLVSINGKFVKTKQEAYTIISRSEGPLYIRLQKSAAEAMLRRGSIALSSSDPEPGDHWAHSAPGTTTKEELRGWALAMIFSGGRPADGDNGKFIIREHEAGTLYNLCVVFDKVVRIHNVKIDPYETGTTVGKKRLGDWNTIDEVVAALSAAELPEGWPLRLTQGVNPLTRQLEDSSKPPSNVLLHKGPPKQSNITISKPNPQKSITASAGVDRGPEPERSARWIHQVDSGGSRSKEDVKAWASQILDLRYVSNDNGKFVIREYNVNKGLYQLCLIYKSKVTIHAIYVSPENEGASTTVNKKHYGDFSTLDQVILALSAQKAPRDSATGKQWPARLTAGLDRTMTLIDPLTLKAIIDSPNPGATSASTAKAEDSKEFVELLNVPDASEDTEEGIKEQSQSQVSASHHEDVPTVSESEIIDSETPPAPPVKASSKSSTGDSTFPFGSKWVIQAPVEDKGGLNGWFTNLLSGGTGEFTKEENGNFAFHVRDVKAGTYVLALIYKRKVTLHPVVIAGHKSTVNKKMYYPFESIDQMVQVLSNPEAISELPYLWPVLLKKGWTANDEFEPVSNAASQTFSALQCIEILRSHGIPEHSYKTATDVKELRRMVLEVNQQKSNSVVVEEQTTVDSSL